MQIRSLSQLKDKDPIKEIVDDLGIHFKLVKSAYDSSTSIPNPALVYFFDWWDKEYPGTNGQVYCYACMGIKRPVTDTEKPSLVIYTWYSTVGDKNFTPASITQQEWLRANVYAAPLPEWRMPIFNTLCGIKQTPEQSLEDTLISLPKSENNGIS